jgi:predicted nuclease with TOPRIM domain
MTKNNVVQTSSISLLEEKIQQLENDKLFLLERYRSVNQLLQQEQANTHRWETLYSRLQLKFFKLEGEQLRLQKTQSALKPQITSMSFFKESSVQGLPVNSEKLSLT